MARCRRPPSRSCRAAGAGLSSSSPSSTSSSCGRGSAPRRRSSSLSRTSAAGDTIVTTGGPRAQVARAIDDAEIEAELAPNVPCACSDGDRRCSRQGRAGQGRDHRRQELIPHPPGRRPPPPPFSFSRSISRQESHAALFHLEDPRDPGDDPSPDCSSWFRARSAPPAISPGRRSAGWLTPPTIVLGLDPAGRLACRAGSRQAAAAEEAGGESARRCAPASPRGEGPAGRRRRHPGARRATAHRPKRRTAPRCCRSSASSPTASPPGSAAPSRSMWRTPATASFASPSPTRGSPTRCARPSNSRSKCCAAASTRWAPRSRASSARATSRVVVQVPGLQEPERLKEIIGKTAQTRVPPRLRTRRQPGREQGAEQVGEGQGRSASRIRSWCRARTSPTPSRASTSSAERRAGRELPLQHPRRPALRRSHFENVGRLFAIVLDDKVISAPRILTPITGGSGQISGRFTVERPTTSPFCCAPGALPAKLDIIEERTVGPASARTPSTPASARLTSAPASW